MSRIKRVDVVPLEFSLIPFDIYYNTKLFKKIIKLHLDVK